MILSGFFIRKTKVRFEKLKSAPKNRENITLDLKFMEGSLIYLRVFRLLRRLVYTVSC